MKKILIPTDFSLKSYQTIDYVCSLFKNEYCEFNLFHTYTYDVNSLNAIELLHADDEWFDKPKVESLKQIGKIREYYNLKFNNPKHEFNSISECVTLVEGIKNNIKEMEIDLVIVTGKAEKMFGKTTKNILDKIISCPILIVPPHASICKDICLTIASDFKQKINTHDIDNFCKTIENTNINIGILVLEEQKQLTNLVVNNLESLRIHLKENLDNRIGLEYIKPSYRLKDYALFHKEGILCIIDKKPDLFRKIGFYKSSVISKLKKLNMNTVLTVHQ
ncbi:universal stress protein [Confluentibacter sediminis]|uniref:universal stress protein n=1 Tax=Confluentibacter sediminis TaxID=2219045 RepID=UPI000DACDFBE|nr:universal stress protein [Confluentibacter sediminis]